MYQLILFGLVVLVIIYMTQSEKFTTASQHCPKYCSPFQYPDMYSPKSSCGDPFNWGFTYSTGRCPKMFEPVPRRFPSITQL